MNVAGLTNTAPGHLYQCVDQHATSSYAQPPYCGQLELLGELPVRKL
jgi:hypothetical protein